MAVDIVLVLQSEHRRIHQLVDRCGRTSRGFSDPLADLHTALRCHVMAATTDVYPVAAKASDPDSWPSKVFTDVRLLLERESGDEADLMAIADDLVCAEQRHVLPVLEALGLGTRRRLGKVFRMRRDSTARAITESHRRRRSQTELYELARRAGVEHRSRMTQAQLQAAIEERGLQL